MTLLHEVGTPLALLVLLAAGCSGAPQSDANPPSAARHTGFVETNGGSLYYEEAGSGGAVILLHSMNTNLHIWDAQFEALAGQYRVIRYDARGFGRSRGDSVDFTDYDDLLAVMDHLDLRKAILVGLSLGGMTAIEFTLEHPERVIALVLSGTGLNGYEYTFSEEARARMAATRKALAEGDMSTAAMLSTQGYFDTPERPWTAVDSGLRTTIHAMILGSTNRLALNTTHHHHFLEPKAIERVGEIRVPVLLMLGGYESPNEYGIADLIEQNVPGTQRAIIPGAGHLTSMENPTAFNEALTAFLSSVSAAGN